MSLNFLTRIRPAPLQLPEDQVKLIPSPSSTTTADVSEKSSSALPAKIESGVKNLKNFMLRFNPNLPTAPTSRRKDKKNVPKSNIGTPIIGKTTAFRKIDAPAPGELKDKIEKCWVEKKNNLNSETLVNWSAYFQLTEGSSLHADIAALKNRLMDIDQKVGRSIDELRLTAYDDLRKAKTHYTPTYEIQAKNSTKRTFKERLSIGAHRAELKAQRMAERRKAVEEQEALDINDAFGRFEHRVTNEFEPARLEDMSNACVDLLRKHLARQIPIGLIYQLVREISPDAVERYLQDHSTFPKDSLLLTSLAAAITSDDARVLLGRVPGR